MFEFQGICVCMFVLCVPVSVLDKHTNVSAQFTMSAKKFNKVDSGKRHVEAQLNFMWLCDTNNMINLSALEMYVYVR